jgi:hypothetical protein
VFRFKHPARYADQDSQEKWAASTVELWQFGDRPGGENRVCLAKTLQRCGEMQGDVSQKCVTKHNHTELSENENCKLLCKTL